MLPLEPPGPGTYLVGCQCRSVIDEDGRFLQETGGRGHARPVVVVQTAGTQLALVDSADRRHHAHRQLLPRHLHAEHRYRYLALDGHILRDVHGEGGLAHGRASRHHDQIGVLQPAGGLVEVGKAGGDAGDGISSLEEILDLLDGGSEQVLHADEATPPARTFLRDLEHQLFGMVQQFGTVTPVGIEGALADLVGDPDELAENGPLPHDGGIGLDVCRRGGVLCQRTQIGQPSRRLQLTDLLQTLGKGDGIERGVALRQLLHGAEDEAVIATVEVLFVKQVGHLIPGIAVQHQAAQHGLFGLDGVGRHLERFGRRLHLVHGIGEIRHVTSCQLSSHRVSQRAILLRL